MSDGSDRMADVIARAGVRRVYATGPLDPCVEVRFAVRRGQAASKGDPIVSAGWTHACVEGDAEWTDLTSGLLVDRVESLRTVGGGAVRV